MIKDSHNRFPVLLESEGERPLEDESMLEWSEITKAKKRLKMIAPRKKKTKELKRRNNITVKLTDIELELLNQKAEMSGTSKAGYLRNLLIGTPMKVRYEIVADMQDLRKLAGDFRGSVKTYLKQKCKLFGCSRISVISA